MLDLSEPQFALDDNRSRTGGPTRLFKHVPSFFSAFYSTLGGTKKDGLQHSRLDRAS